MAGRGAGHASEETKAQRWSAPWHVCFPNQGSERQVRQGEQVMFQNSSSCVPVTGCFLGRWGRGWQAGGGHPSGPSLRKGSHPCTCTHAPHASTHSPPSASGRRPGLHLPCVLNRRGGSAGGVGAVDAPGYARPTPEPLTQQRAGRHRAPLLVPLSVNRTGRKEAQARAEASGEGQGEQECVWFQIRGLGLPRCGGR